MQESNGTMVQRVAVIGNYLPRQCGIATFTSDLCESLAQAFPTVDVFAVAMNDRVEGYDYPARVRFEVPQEEIAAYRQVADVLNMRNYDLVCLQHEYGIFGGKSGSHILALLRQLRMPIVTTLHTILREPNPAQRRVLLELANLSQRLVVMSARGAAFLQEIYGISADKIDIIPHGIPDVPFVDPNFYKDQMDAQGQTVLLTFGLLSENKGIEHVIAALPAILERYPNVVYLVLGATHPNVKRLEGERYRQVLQRMASELGIAERVRFYDQFVDIDELVRFIGAADVYITPYLNPTQIVSGTLAYTVGAGKAVISTPYWYAEELLADGRGRLVPFRDPSAITQTVLELLDDEAERHTMRKQAYMLGREMIWAEVAQRYMETFVRARNECYHQVWPTSEVLTLDKRSEALPPICLDHLRGLTDDTGLFQHAIHTLPNYNEGYTTDDNARALLAAMQLEARGVPETEPLAARYLSFLVHAFNQQQGRFRNFMAFDRRWLEAVGSEDSHARALWALGATLGRSHNPRWLAVAGPLFDQALPAALAFTNPRPWAYTVLGASLYLRRYRSDRATAQVRTTLAERLLAQYEEQRDLDWPWFEPVVTYDNAVLPHALLLAGDDLGRSDMRAAGIEALTWLATIQQAEPGHFAPIGCNGFYPRGGVPARFDQQPLEAQAMVLACLDAYRLTGEEHWYRGAKRTFEWFLGRNDLRQPLYDPTTGGCCDGLEPDRVNQNQGAESTLACLLALLALTEGEGMPTTGLPALSSAALRRQTEVR